MAKKILLMDDDTTTAHSESNTLQEYGYKVVQARNTQQAISVIQEEPDIDLLLIDIDLGSEANGIHTAQEIIAQRSLPVVFLSQHAEKDYNETINEVTGYGYVPKNSGQLFLIESINMAFKLFAAHQATKESEAKYRAAFMTSPDSVNINRIDGLYVDINEGFTKLTGYGRQEVIGKTSSQINIWAIPEDRKKLVTQLEEHGTVENLESVFRCKDGSLKVGLMSAKILSLHNQPHILSITRDITKKKETEERLQSSEHKFRAIFDQAADGILIGNNQGIITEANISMTTLTGYTQEELIGNSINILFEEDELARTPLRYDLVLVGTTVQRERNIVTKKGKVLPVIMNTKKVEDDCLQAIFHDISELREAERSLKESEERFRLAVEGTRDGLWDWDLLTNQAYHSDRFATMLGYQPDELPYTNAAWRDLLHPDDKEVALQRVQDYLNGKTGVYESTFRLRAKDGSYRWVTGRGKALFNTQGTPVRFVGFNTDITDQRRQADKVERLLEEKDYLLQEITHRVKNNLAMISSLINLKQSTLNDDSSLIDLKHQINAIRVVHEKLHSTQEYTTINFRTYYRELLGEIFSSLTTPRVQFELDMEEVALPTKTIIPLGLILNEMATNAIKHGFLPEIPAHFTVRMIKNEQKNHYSLSFSNSGTHLEKNILQNSTETVGLRLVEALVDQIRGSMELKTEPETTFIITFQVPDGI